MKPKTSDRDAFVAWMGESVKSYAAISEQKQAELLKIISTPMTIKDISEDFGASKAVTRAAVFRLVTAGKLDFATPTINKSIYFNACTLGSAYVFFPASYQPPLRLHPPSSYLEDIRPHNNDDKYDLLKDERILFDHNLKTSIERLSEKCFKFMAQNDGCIAMHHDGRLKINFTGSMGDKLRIMAAINEVLR